MENIFSKEGVDRFIQRINNLSPETKPQWGKMSVDQMLAHCNVAYEMTYSNVHPKPGAFKRFLLKWLVKNGVVNEKPYPKNSRTAPQFIIKDERNFEKEKERLIAYLKQTLALGPAHFDGKSNLSFGEMTTQEWNNLFAKHLDHHLSQFGV